MNPETVLRRVLVTGMELHTNVITPLDFDVRVPITIQVKRYNWISQRNIDYNIGIIRVVRSSQNYPLKVKGDRPAITGIEAYLVEVAGINVMQRYYRMLWVCKANNRVASVFIPLPVVFYYSRSGRVLPGYEAWIAVIVTNYVYRSRVNIVGIDLNCQQKLPVSTLPWMYRSSYHSA